MIRWLAAVGAVAGLPLVVVPVFDYSSPNTFDEPMSIAGLLSGIEIRPEGVAGALMLLIWVGLAVRPWLAAPGWGWVACLVASLGLAAFLVVGTANYWMIWDGIDSSGRPTGGLVTAVPGIGTALLILAVACLLVAGVLATRRLMLVHRHRRKNQLP